MRCASAAAIGDIAALQLACLMAGVDDSVAIYYTTKPPKQGKEKARGVIKRVGSDK